MEPVTTVHYLVLSAALLLIGTIGVLTRRNIVIILMSIELILNAVNINLIAFSQHLQNMGGQIFTIFVMSTLKTVWTCAEVCFDSTMRRAMIERIFDIGTKSPGAAGETVGAGVRVASAVAG